MVSIAIDPMHSGMVEIHKLGDFHVFEYKQTHFAINF